MHSPLATSASRTSLRGATAGIIPASLMGHDAPDAADHVVADTFLRFKGLERPYVIVTELSTGPERYDVRMHVALTRATLACVVVGMEEEIARDARLVALR